MNQQYFVVEFAHSLHGQFKRIQISHKSLAYLFCSLVVVFLLAFGLFSSYLQMSWKVSHYNQLRADFDRLRTRYQELQKASMQRKEQIASLETLATEVSVAYGISQPIHKETDLDPSASLDSDNDLTPTVKESIEQYNFLRAANFSTIYHQYAFRWQLHNQPSLWPVIGQLRSSFGVRTDPFSGEGAFHTGIDLAALSGTQVHVTADGVVASTGWSGRYGKLVVINHGNNIETYYAHLSQIMVVPGEEVRSGQVIALSGGTGRVTSPHLHYEVRLGGTPVNPYKFLSKPDKTTTASAAHSSDLGL